MKIKIVSLLIILAVGLAGLYLHKLKLATEESPLTKEPTAQESTLTGQMETSANHSSLKASSEPDRDPASEEAIENLDLEQVEAKLLAIDEKLNKENWVERANSGKLNKAQQAELRRMLSLRNRYFAKKIELI